LRRYGAGLARNRQTLNAECAADALGMPISGTCIAAYSTTNDHLLTGGNMRSASKIALCAAAVLAFAGPVAAQSKNAPLQTGEAARPADAGANKPSESGAQSTTRSGAATGAGQPQGGGQPAEAQSAGSAKSRTQAQDGTGNAKLSKQTRSNKKRKHRQAKRTDATSADTAAAAPAGSR